MSSTREQLSMDSPGSPQEPLSARLPIYRSMISLRTFSSREDDFLDTQPLVDETASRELTGRSRSISWKEVLWPQVAALLWLVPTVTLLVLNIRGYIIGADAWRPFGHCFVDTENEPDILAKYSMQSRNLLGILQVLAKVLEVWFCVIAAWLVYSTTMILAGGQKGLPIAYMTRASEFTDLASFFDRSLWTSIPRHISNTTGKPTKRPAYNRLWLWVVLTCSLGVLCNLMGPAIAVLILPSAQWRESKSSAEGLFLRVNSDRLPLTGNSSFSQHALHHGCNTSIVEKMQYSCTKRGWSTDLDAMVENYLSSDKSSGRPWAGVSVQDLISFTIHESKEPELWTSYQTPSRQTLSALSADLEVLGDIINGYYISNTERTIAKSQQVSLELTGPVFSASANMWLGYDDAGHWDVNIDNSNASRRAVRCYANYYMAYTPYARDQLVGNYTRCVKWGKGWENYHMAKFSIDGIPVPEYNITQPKLHIEAWTSDTVAYLREGIPPDEFNAECLHRTGEHETAPQDCSLDILFSIDSDSSLYERATNVTTISVYTDSMARENHPNLTFFVVDFAASMQFAQYSLSSSYNESIYLATTSTKGFDRPWRILVHPAWLLYAWGTNAGQISSVNRGAALELANVMYNFWTSEYYQHPDPLSKTNDVNALVDTVAMVPIMQMLSLIDYETREIRPGEKTSSSNQYPKLKVNTRVYVWQYGMNSRTAYVGVFVAICGCVVVVVQFVLGFIDRRKYRSGAQLLVAALEYKYNADFAGMPHDERAVAKVRYRLEDADYMAGRFKFYKVD